MCLSILECKSSFSTLVAKGKTEEPSSWEYSDLNWSYQYKIKIKFYNLLAKHGETPHTYPTQH